ncbi:MAG: hypothetical protein IJF65_05640 [Clostridia bacterium]|nr:hypothetical protein [Clostridia bacterium]
MKRWFFGLFVLMLLPFAAVAEGELDLPKVSKDRFQVVLPEGVALKGETIKDDGRITFTVDAQKTDWTRLILYGGRDSLTYTLRVQPPSGEYSLGGGQMIRVPSQRRVRIP